MNVPQDSPRIRWVAATLLIAVCRLAVALEGLPDLRHVLPYGVLQAEGWCMVFLGGAAVVSFLSNGQRFSPRTKILAAATAIAYAAMTYSSLRSAQVSVLGSLPVLIAEVLAPAILLLMVVTQDTTTTATDRTARWPTAVPPLAAMGIGLGLGACGVDAIQANAGFVLAVTLPDAMGIFANTEVLVHGRKVGSVDLITLQGNEVKLDLTLNGSAQVCKGWTYVARIRTNVLEVSRYVELAPEPRDDACVQGDLRDVTIRGARADETEPTLNDYVAVMSPGDLRVIVSAARDLATHEHEFVEAATAAATRLAPTLQAVDGSLARADQTLASVDATLALGRSTLIGLQGTVRHVDAVLGPAGTPGTVSGTLAALDGTLTAATPAVGHLDALLTTANGIDVNALMARGLVVWPRLSDGWMSCATQAVPCPAKARKGAGARTVQSNPP